VVDRGEIGRNQKERAPKSEKIALRGGGVRREKNEQSGLPFLASGRPTGGHLRECSVTTTGQGRGRQPRKRRKSEGGGTKWTSLRMPDIAKKKKYLYGHQDH